MTNRKHVNLLLNYNFIIINFKNGKQAVTKKLVKILTGHSKLKLLFCLFYTFIFKMIHSIVTP